MHSLKLTFSHLKIDGWKMYFLLKVRPFSGAICLVAGRVPLQVPSFLEMTLDFRVSAGTLPKWHQLGHQLV